MFLNNPSNVEWEHARQKLIFQLKLVWAAKAELCEEDQLSIPMDSNSAVIGGTCTTS